MEILDDRSAETSTARGQPESKRFTSSLVFNLTPINGKQLQPTLTPTGGAPTADSNGSNSRNDNPLPALQTLTIAKPGTLTVASPGTLTIAPQNSGQFKVAQSPEVNISETPDFKIAETPTEPQTFGTAVASPIQNTIPNYGFTQVTPSCVHESVTPSPTLETLEVNAPTFIVKNTQPNQQDIFPPPPESIQQDIFPPPPEPITPFTSSPALETLEINHPTIVVKKPQSKQQDIFPPPPGPVTTPFAHAHASLTPDAPTRNPSYGQERTPTDPSHHARFTPNPIPEVLEVTTPSLTITKRSNNNSAPAKSQAPPLTTNSAPSHPSNEVPADILVDQLVDQLVNQMSDNPVDTPADTQADTPVNKLADTLMDKPVEKPVDTVADTLWDTLMDKPVGKPVDRPVDKLADTLMDKPSGPTNNPASGGKVPSEVAGKKNPTCAGCHMPITGSFSNAMDKAWHTSCFNCSSCGGELGSQGFLEKDGKPYCEPCYNASYAPVCAQCNKPISGTCMTAIGKSFHPECFVCFVCGEQFGSEGFFVEDGNPYCQQDHDEIFAIRCDFCFLPISGGRYVEALGKSFHNEHFMCTVPLCEQNLQGESFYVVNNEQYCEQHKTGLPANQTSDL